MACPTRYCPECDRECGCPDCPTNAAGVCVACGKPPVPWAARNKNWFWCTDHLQWHDAPCVQDPVHHCCLAKA